MSFLSIATLWALPLAALPIVIHLLHQRRHPTVVWAATMFLERARVHRRGPARLRRWLILASRVILLAAIIAAFARPLSDGRWSFGAAGFAGKKAVSVVVLDRSPSMQRRVGTGESTRLDLAKRRVADAMTTLGIKTFWLIESVDEKPIAMKQPRRLLDAPMTTGVSASADIPAMILEALSLASAQGESVVDLWVCSDRQRGDWNPDAVQWDGIRRRAAEMGRGLRMHVTEFASPGVNASIRVNDVRPMETDEGEMTALSVIVDCEDQDVRQLPVRLTIGESTSEMNVRLRGGRGEIAEVLVPNLESSPPFGNVSIPADANASDNRWFFVGPSKAGRSVVLVQQDACVGLEVALGVLGEVTVFETTQWNGEGLGGAVAVAWQGPLPSGDAAKSLVDFVGGGGSLICFPPQSDAPGDTRFEEVGWTDAVSGLEVSSSFQGIEFGVDRFHPVDGPVVNVSTIPEAGAVIAELRVGEGRAFFCGMDVSDDSAAFVQEGTVMYGLLATAIDAGAGNRFGSGSLVAGSTVRESLGGRLSEVRDISGAGTASEGGQFEFGFHAGIYSLPASGSSERQFAINRPLSESDSEAATDEALRLPVTEFTWNPIAMDQASGRDTGLVREVWGSVWALVVAVMLFEGWLSLPPKSSSPSTSRSAAE